MSNSNYGGFYTEKLKRRVEEYLEYSKKISPWLTADEQNYKKSFAEFMYVINSRTRITKDDTAKEDDRNLSLNKLLTDVSAELMDVSDELLKIVENFKQKNMYIGAVRQTLDSLDISISKQCTFSAASFYGFETQQLLSPSVLRLIIAVKEYNEADNITLLNIVHINRDLFFLIKLSGWKARYDTNAENFMMKRDNCKLDSFKKKFVLKIPLTSFDEYKHG